MARSLRVLLALGGMVLALSVRAAGILVIQTAPESAENPDPERNLAFYFAGKMNDDGRLRPIVWSVADVVFRTATEDGQIKPPQNPTDKDVLEIAAKLRCEYVMEVGLWRRESGLYARARLFKGSKEIWRDPVPGPQVGTPAGQAAQGHPEDKDAKSIMVSVDGTSRFEAVLETLAQTWMDQLTLGGPLKDLEAKPRIPTPQPDPGTQPPPVEPTPPPKIDNRQLMEEVMRLMAARDHFGAIALLRDGVDSAPFDLERRRALVEALMAAGMAEDAARSARLGADAIPEGAALWAMAARAWMAAGKDAEAEKDLNEAVARDPENAETRLLMAELALAKSDMDRAIEHANASLEKAESADGRLLRGMIKILRGEDGAEDLAKAKEMGALEGPFREARAYALALRSISGALGDFGEAGRNLMTEARRDRLTPSVETWRKEIHAKADRGITLLSALATPKAHEASDGERRLALKMLIQSMSELSGWIKDADEDLLADASISLGEALRRWREAEQRFAEERDSKHDGNGTGGAGDGRPGDGGRSSRHALHTP